MSISEQVGRLEQERDELRRQLGKVMSERDALQARIDAGVRLHRSDRYGWGSMESPDGTHTGLLVDVQPIAQVDDDRRTWTRADGSTRMKDTSFSMVR